jgi:hypothetical protein
VQDWDAIILGAGAAGLFCAGRAGQRGLRVLLIDHAERVAEKVRISGGGRANFTNRDLDAAAPQRHFVGANPQFCRSALARFTPQDFIALMDRHGLAWHEKHRGQLFCDESAEHLIALLLAECAAARAHGGLVERWQPCRVERVEFQAKSDSSALSASAGSYIIHSERGPVRAPALVVATGGLSVPKIGASGLGLALAQQFGLRVTDTRPGLVPLTFDSAAWAPYAALAGLALPVAISTVAHTAPPSPTAARPGGENHSPHAPPLRGAPPPEGRPGGRRAQAQRVVFHEDLLFTHRGLSGPAVLQISSYWQPGAAITIDLAPGVDLAAELRAAKTRSRRLLANELASWLPARLADTWTRLDAAWQRPVADVPDKALARLAESLQHWPLVPTGTEGWRKAEVTVGGVDTRDLSSQTLQARAQAGLFFIGEVVDITGWLGGYNFQWAWASAAACAEALPRA